MPSQNNPAPAKTKVRGLRGSSQLHEDGRDDRRLDRADRQRDNGVERTKGHIGERHGEREQGQKRKPSDDKRERRTPSRHGDRPGR